MFGTGTCMECSAPFQKKKRNHRFCCNPCYSKFDIRVRGPERKAAHKQWQIDNRDRVNANQRKYNARKSQGLPTRYCKKCGNKLPTKLGNHKFCSVSCRDQTRSFRRMDGQPWFPLLSGAKQRSTKGKIPYDLTPEWATARWTGKCELTGIPFNSPQDRVGNKRLALSPSIDRIEPSKGYVQENCRFILWALNAMKRDEPDEVMIRIACALADNMRHHLPP